MKWYEAYMREAYARLYARLASLDAGQQALLQTLRDVKQDRRRPPLPIPARDTSWWERCDRLRYAQLIVVTDGQMRLSPLCLYYLDAHGERFPWETPED